jgi:hypothetical protein
LQLCESAVIYPLLPLGTTCETSVVAVLCSNDKDKFGKDTLNRLEGYGTIVSCMLERFAPDTGPAPLSTRRLEGQVIKIRDDVATIRLIDASARELTAKCHASELKQAGIGDDGLFECLIEKYAGGASVRLEPLARPDWNKLWKDAQGKKYGNVKVPSHDTD